MSASREELRDDLQAMINASPELGEEERDHLADVFLDRLEASYRLVPRGQSNPESGRPAPVRGAFPFLSFWPVIPLAFAFLAVWLIAASAFALIHHVPIFLFVILLILVLRFRPWGPRRRMFR